MTKKQIRELLAFYNATWALLAPMVGPPGIAAREHVRALARTLVEAAYKAGMDLRFEDQHGTFNGENWGEVHHAGLATEITNP